MTRERWGDHAYRVLPPWWRENDHSPRAVTNVRDELLPFMHRFCRTFGGAYDDLIDTIRGVLDWFDATRAPADVLPHLALNNGWPLDTGLDTAQRLIIRKIHNLVYQQKGSLRGLQHAIQAFTGLQVSIWAYNTGSRWLMLTDSAVNTSVPGGALSQVGGGAGSISAAGASSVLSIGDNVLVLGNLGEREIATVMAVTGDQVIFDRALTYQYPSGADIIRMRGADIADIAQERTGLGSVMLGIGEGDPCVVLDGAPPNQGLDGTTILADGPEHDCIDDEGRALRFTFVIEIPTDGVTLPPWKLRTARFLAAYMKPARCHYRIDYVDSMPQVPWFVIGASALDNNAMLYPGA